MLNFEDTDFKGESVWSVRGLNLEVVECTRPGFEGRVLTWGVGDRSCEVRFQGC